MSDVELAGQRTRKIDQPMTLNDDRRADHVKTSNVHKLSLKGGETKQGSLLRISRKGFWCSTHLPGQGVSASHLQRRAGNWQRQDKAMVDLPGINYDARPARARPSRRGCRAVNRQAATKLASLERAVKHNEYRDCNFSHR